MTFTSLFGSFISLILFLQMARINDKKLLQKIALVIKDLRDETGVSQEEVYNETNVHVGRIETANSNLTISTLSVLLRFFNISFSDFFLRVETKK